MKQSEADAVDETSAIDDEARPQARCQPAGELERLREDLRESDRERSRWASSLAGTQSRFFNAARQVIEQQDDLAALKLDLIRTAQQSEVRKAALAQAMSCQNEGGHPELQARNAELQTHVEELQTARDVDRKLRIDLTRARTTAEGNHERARTCIEQLQTRVDQVTAELAARQTAIDTFEVSVERLVGQVDRLTQELTARDALIATHETTIDELRSQATQREQAVAKMEAMMTQLRDQLAKASQRPPSKRTRRSKSTEGVRREATAKKPRNKPAATAPIAAAPAKAPVSKPLARRMIDRAKKLIGPATRSVGLLRWLARR